MSDPALNARPLSESEAAEFRDLSLTAEHWSALAPVPILIQPDLRTPDYSDFRIFLMLGEYLPTGVSNGSEAAEFWSRHLGSRPPGAALGLLGWHLAHNVSRQN